MQAISTEIGGSEQALRYIPKIEKREGGSEFKVTINIADQKTIHFRSASSPDSVFTQPPQNIKNPNEILNLRRVKCYDGPEMVLERNWHLQTKGMPLLLGTSDHHELYYQLLQGGISSTSPDDVLINFDSHDDIKQEKIDPNNNNVSLGNFVGQGFLPERAKVWDYYVLVAPDKTHGKGMKLNFPNQSERFSTLNIRSAMEKALKVAKQKGSKVILTIDLDFFGSYDTDNFDPQSIQKYREYLAIIFDFVRRNSASFRIVNITESLIYAEKGNQQIEMLYKEIAKLLEPKGRFPLSWLNRGRY